MAPTSVAQLPIPAWCKPNGWVHHKPTNTVFQAARLQIDSATQQLYLRDTYGHSYAVPECQGLTPRTLTAPATIAGTPIQVYPQKNGLLISGGKAKKLVQIFDDCDRAAESLANFFHGVISHTEELNP